MIGWDSPLLYIIEGCVYFWIVHNGAVLELSFRKADEADLPALVSLFVDDPLGAQREDPSMPLNPAYGAAFVAIDSLNIVAFLGGLVSGTLASVIAAATHTVELPKQEGKQI